MSILFRLRTGGGNSKENVPNSLVFIGETPGRNNQAQGEMEFKRRSSVIPSSIYQVDENFK